MSELYSNIKKLRKEKSWSQEYLAEQMGYSGRSMISKVERGEIDLTQSRIQQFATIFGVSPDDLMGRTPIRRRIDLEGCITHEISSDDVQLIEAFKNAPTATQRAICTLLGLDGKPN